MKVSSQFQPACLRYCCNLLTKTISTTDETGNVKDDNDEKKDRSCFPVTGAEPPLSNFYNVKVKENRKD